MKNFVALITIMSLPLTLTAQGTMESSDYRMQSDSINFAGSLSSSTNYTVEDSLGEVVSGESGSTDYSTYLGYQFMGFAVQDTEAPTAPASLTAQVISSSEIELSWNASTDNVAVDRYYIYRDGARVDDVAIFPRDFTDTGLTASTSYEYNISAVDGAGNESLWSATTTATTTAESVVISSLSGGSSSRVVANLSDLFITSNDVNAVVSFWTSFSTISEIYWGRDMSYADGSATLPSSSYHSFLIDGLTPSTQYYLKVVLRDEYGNSRTIENISFRTLNVALSESPANVSGFVADAKENSIELSWNMPSDPRVTGVTILRSEEMYPLNPTDGVVVFEFDNASGVEIFEDRNVEAGKTYYYSIFTRDLAGNVSSGAVTMSRILLMGEDTPINPLDNLLP
ncbi:MAG: fibronectin type III domain-containing protein, partial [Minisyncoccota bacterium]